MGISWIWCVVVLQHIFYYILMDVLFFNVSFPDCSRCVGEWEGSIDGFVKTNSVFGALPKRSQFCSLQCGRRKKCGANKGRGLDLMTFEKGRRNDYFKSAANCIFLFSFRRCIGTRCVHFLWHFVVVDLLVHLVLGTFNHVPKFTNLNVQRIWSGWGLGVGGWLGRPH